MKTNWSVFAEGELRNAILYYRNIRVGLDKDLMLCVDAAIELIVRHPDLGSLVYDSVRRKLIRRFPYGIFYITSDKELYVIGFRHYRQSDVKYKNR